MSDAGECSTSGLDDTAKVDYVSGQLARSSIMIICMTCISIVFHPSVTLNVSIWLGWAKPTLHIYLILMPYTFDFDISENIHDWILSGSPLQRRGWGTVWGRGWAHPLEAASCGLGRACSQPGDHTQHNTGDLAVV